MIFNAFVSNLGSLVVEGFGYDPFHTLLLQISYGLFDMFSIITAIHIHKRLQGQKRCVVAICYILPSLAGSTCMYALPRDQKTVSLIYYYLSPTLTSSLLDIFSVVDRQ